MAFKKTYACKLHLPIYPLNCRYLLAKKIQNMSLPPAISVKYKKAWSIKISSIFFWVL